MREESNMRNFKGWRKPLSGGMHKASLEEIILDSDD